MARFNGTPQLGREDLPGTAFLVNADRQSKGLPPLEGTALAAVARLRQFSATVDDVRRENGRKRKNGTTAVGVRVGVGPVSDVEGGPGLPADPTAYDPANVSEATDILARVASILTPDEARLIFRKALGVDAGSREDAGYATQRKRLQRARAKLTEALLPGGALADLGAEGYAILAPKGGAR